MALTLTDIYNKLTWKNSPDHSTPVNADNLNHIETGIKNNNTGLRAAETAINQNTSDIATINNNLTELERSGAMPNLDYGNPLHTFSSGNLSYTATKTCYLFGTVSADSGSNIMTINNQQYVLVTSSSGYYRLLNPIKINAGDTVIVSQPSVALHALDTI